MIVVAALALMMVAVPQMASAGSANENEWHVYTVDSEGDAGTHASLALDRSGFPHMSYYELTSGGLRYANWTGSGWRVATVDSVSAGYGTSIALDQAGIPHIAYATDGGLRYARWSGSEWSAQTVENSGAARSPSIALDGLGDPHIGYYDYTSNPVLKHAVKVGLEWFVSPVDSTGNPCQGSSIAIDGQGHVTIAYLDISRSSPRVAQWGGERWARETVDASSANGFISIRIDSQDRPHISYESVLSHGYAKRTGTTWSVERVNPDVTGSYKSFALDSTDNPHMSYFSASGYLAYLTRTSTGQWKTEVVDSSSVVGLYAPLALDENDIPHIAYYDLTSGGLKYASLVELGPGLEGPVVGTPTPIHTGIPGVEGPVVGNATPIIIGVPGPGPGPNETYGIPHVPEAQSSNQSMPPIGSGGASVERDRMDIEPPPITPRDPLRLTSMTKTSLR